WDLTVVADAPASQAMLEFARQQPLAWIGFDTEFRYDRPGVAVSGKKVAHDPSSLRPLLLSLALAEPDGQDGGTVYPLVIDLRVRAVHPALGALLRLPIPFVGHYAHAEILCLLQLGLPEPARLWDTWVHEKALHLGRNHKTYRLPPAADELARARAGEEVE